MDTGRRLLLVDGHSLANRAFYALPALSTNAGVPTGAVFGFLTMLFRFLQEKKPTHVAVAFDHPSPTFRHGEYDEYKITRKPSPPDFKAQIPVLKEVLDTLNLPVLELAGFEADDIIGTLSTQAQEHGFSVSILSGDKDCLQLVSPDTRAILPVRGITQVKEYDPEGVLKDMGFTPAQVTDYKALAGDSSDNIPGVKGIGEKTAVSLLERFGSLDGIYEHLEEVTPARVRNLLAEAKSIAFLSKNLATINRDVPLPLGPEDLEWKGPDIPRAHAKFVELEFYSLAQRLGSLRESEKAGETSGGVENPEGTHPIQALAAPAAQAPAAGSPDYRVVDTVDGLARFAEEAKATGRLAVYAEVSEITRDFRWPSLIGVSTGTRCFLLRQPEMNPEAWQDALWTHFGPLLVDDSVTKVGFDLKWLFTLCFKRGIRFSGKFFDVLVASYLLDPTRSSYRLPEIARKYTRIEVPFIPMKAEREADPASAIAATEAHFAVGAGSCLEAASGLKEDLERQGLTHLAEDVEFPLIEVLAAMEATGVGVDLPLGRSIRKEFGEALKSLEEVIYGMAKEEFNLGSPKQLAHILFDRLGLKPVKKTKTGFSTDAEVLESLSLEHELPAKILEYRQYAKLKSTYLDVLEDVINPTTGRIHSTFHQTVTATGRLSSSEPNLQNIPVRGELGRSLRRIFVPSQGRLFLAADYSQIELRIMAHMANDPSMIDAFVRGEDIHRRTASEMFGVPLDRVDSDLRSKAKAVNFGVIYGISDFGLARNTGVSREEARHFIETYFARYPMVKQYMEESIENARKTGYAVTIMGRRRPIPDIESRVRQKRSFAERTAINTPIQGSAADIIKLAMVKIYKRLQDEGLISKLILQVHDELIFEIPPSEEQIMRQLVTEEMEGVMQLKVPLKVDLDVGESWYDV